MKTSVYTCGYREHIPINFRLDKDVLFLKVRTPEPVKIYYAPGQFVKCARKCNFKLWTTTPESRTVTGLVAVCDPGKSSNFSFIVSTDVKSRSEIVREWVVQQYMYNYTYIAPQDFGRPKVNTVPLPGTLLLLAAGLVAAKMWYYIKHGREANGK